MYENVCTNTTWNRMQKAIDILVNEKGTLWWSGKKNSVEKQHKKAGFLGCLVFFTIVKEICFISFIIDLKTNKDDYVK